MESASLRYRRLSNRPSDLWKEGRAVLEVLGYLHRKKHLVVKPTSNGLGLLARRRNPAPWRDHGRDAREWRERRRRDVYTRELGRIVDRLGDDDIPPQLWTDLARLDRAPQHLPTLPPPGPGHYLKLATSNSAPKHVFGAARAHTRRDKGSFGPDRHHARKTSSRPPLRAAPRSIPQNRQGQT